MFTFLVNKLFSLSYLIWNERWSDHSLTNAPIHLSYNWKDLSAAWKVKRLAVVQWIERVPPKRLFCDRLFDGLSAMSNAL